MLYNMSALKILAGGLGWVLGGPIGALLGVGAGFILEDLIKKSPATGKTHTQRNDFSIAFLVLIAAVIKADGKVKDSELDFVKKYLVRTFAWNGADEAFGILQGMLGQNIDVDPVAAQIRENMDYASRLELLHLLYGVALADGNFSPLEKRLIERIASTMGIRMHDARSIGAMFVQKSNREPYGILNVEPSATDEEIKRSYRALALKFHPDKVAHLGEDYRQQAEEKFRKLNEAYESIKESRGIS